MTRKIDLDALSVEEMLALADDLMIKVQERDRAKELNELRQFLFKFCWAYGFRLQDVDLDDFVGAPLAITLEEAFRAATEEVDEETKLIEQKPSNMNGSSTKAARKGSFVTGHWRRSKYGKKTWIEGHYRGERKRRDHHA